MKYRRIGKSGLKVSEIAFGSWLTGADYGAYSEMVNKAYELGINHFDSANIYGNQPHASEEMLGRALREIPRHSYVLSTKAWGPVGRGPNDRGLGRKHLLSEVDVSLRTLMTDYIDVFYCHRFDTETDLEETLRTLNELVVQGKVLYVGFSEWTPRQITTAVELQKELGLCRFTVSQPEYNLFDRDIEQDVLPLCDAQGIGQVVFSALAQGILTGKYRRGEVVPAGSRVATHGRLFPLGLASADRNRRSRTLVTEYHTEPYATIVENLAGLAQNTGIGLSQLALAWVLRLPQVCSAVVGASRVEQIEENVRAAGVSLGNEVLREIDEILERR